MRETRPSGLMQGRGARPHTSRLLPTLPRCQCQWRACGPPWHIVNVSQNQTVTTPGPKCSTLKRVFNAPFAVFAFIVALPATLLFSTVLRGRCPNCERKGMRGVLSAPDPLLTGDPRPFFGCECDHCHHQFWRFESDPKKVVHIAPSDDRNVRTE